MFLKIIALVFLFIFIIKLFNTDTIPYLRTIWNFIKKFIKTFIYYFVKSFVYGGFLLIKQTVYVVGTSLFVTLGLILIVFFIAQYPTYTLGDFWQTFKHYSIDLYVLSFFTTTYILGLVEVIKQNGGISIHDSIKRHMGVFNFNFEDKTHQSTSNNQNQSTKGQYVYDEETQEYRFEESNRWSF